jgi:hypothetical protein
MFQALGKDMMLCSSLEAQGRHSTAFSSSEGFVATDIMDVAVGSALFHRGSRHLCNTECDIQKVTSLSQETRQAARCGLKRTVGKLGRHLLGIVVGKVSQAASQR